MVRLASPSASAPPHKAPWSFSTTAFGDGVEAVESAVGVHSETRRGLAPSASAPPPIAPWRLTTTFADWATSVRSGTAEYEWAMKDTHEEARKKMDDAAVALVHYARRESATLDAGDTSDESCCWRAWVHAHTGEEADDEPSSVGGSPPSSLRELQAETHGGSSLPPLARALSSVGTTAACTEAPLSNLQLSSSTPAAYQSPTAAAYHSTHTPSDHQIDAASEELTSTCRMGRPLRDRPPPGPLPAPTSYPPLRLAAALSDAEAAAADHFDEKHRRRSVRHSLTHSLTHSCIHAYTYTCLHVHMPTRTHAYRTRIHAYTYTCPHVYMPTSQ